MDLLQFFAKNPQQLTVIGVLLLVIIGMVVVARVTVKYFIGQIAERDVRINNMVKVLVESSEVITRLTDSIQFNNDLIKQEISAKTEELKRHISEVLLKNYHDNQTR